MSVSKYENQYTVQKSEQNLPHPQTGAATLSSWHDCCHLDLSPGSQSLLDELQTGGD